MPPADNSSTIRLISEGFVPGWIGAILFALVGVFVIWQLKVDLRGLKVSASLKYVLYSIRVVLVAAAVWLLCQPALLIIRRWTAPPAMMLIVDAGNSMRVNESAGDATGQLNALEAVGASPISRRNGSASRIARVATATHTEAAATTAALQNALDVASTGLPIAASVSESLNGLALSLRVNADALIAAKNLLPGDMPQPELKSAVSELAGQSQLLIASMEGLISESALVGREASKTPKLLEQFLTRLGKLSTDADRVASKANRLQRLLDKALLSEKDVALLNGTPLTRQSLADRAADRLTLPNADGPAWTRLKEANIESALDQSFKRGLSSPLSGVVLISDGSALTTSPAVENLAKLKVPVSTILVGEDAIEPADSGLVAIDLPHVALVGDAITMRCLVKNLVAKPTPKLTATIAGKAIATRDLALNKAGYDVFEFDWTPSAPGRVQIEFRIQSAQADAYAGNELLAAVVDVYAAKPRVLVVSDRLSNDYAAISQTLTAMPALETRTQLAAQGIGKLRMGSKADEFPATPDDFKSLAMLVLVGDVPAGISSETIASVRKAISAGLHVWVQASAGESARSWAKALGVETKAMTGRQAIEPRDDLWLSLYELGIDRDESLDRWKSLPKAEVSEITSSGIPLLLAEGRAVMQLIPTDAGVILASGISDHAALRTFETNSLVNRILSESLILALAPINEPGRRGGVFPAQPFSDRKIYVFGNASNVAGLQPTTESGAGWACFKVTGADKIKLDANDASINRTVRPLMGKADFKLAARAAPLRSISATTGGRYSDLLSGAQVMPEKLTSSPMSSTRRIRLWNGTAGLAAILLLATSEYLLRRKAGKVM